ncbi:hypothetical protein [Sphingomonas sp. Leaf412]|uniref:hypothetical protein n=1 Tax=Sphingomonas sp. Leaf412 TaxID=1736370 RepID=UPI000A8A456C|nr:hypothetical protein [Sphingomonas sp. Leaf412]
MMSRFLAPLLVPSVMLASPLAAQVAPPVPLPSPSVAATAPEPVATVPAEASALPPPVSATLPPPAPTPTARATPAPRPTPTASPVPRATATAQPAARPSASPAAAASPAAPAASTPAPAASADPAAAVPAAVVAGRPAGALPQVEEPGPLWALPVTGGLVVGLVLMALLIRRRRRRALAGEGEDLPVAAASPAAPDLPAAPDVPVAPLPDAPPPLPHGGADLSFVLHPRRAGVNLLTATLEAEIVVRNDGDATADGVRVVLRLLSAGGDPATELAAVFDDDAGSPVTAPFALAAGEERRLTALATCGRHDLNVVTAADRPMFVPVAAVSVRYADGNRAAQVAQAFALGVERAGAEKLGPFWLDAPSRMHDAVGARAYAPELRR